MKIRFFLLFTIMTLLGLGLLFHGAAEISFGEIFQALLGHEGINSNILWKIRFPKVITASFAGAALAVCGLIMQTYFRNPLAGPFVLGISSGASLGVAIWILASAILPLFLYQLGLTAFAIGGALAVLMLLLFCSRKIGGNVILLILGLVFGYFSSGIINVLVVLSNAHKIKTFLLWTLGSFSRVVDSELIVFASVISISIIICFFFVKTLNALLLGPEYARSLGVNLKQMRFFLLILTAILAGVVTAFCGPIAFLGIIVPHLTRLFFKTTDHRILLPGVVLFGASVALGAEMIANLLISFSLPVNAIMGLIGAPLMIIFIWRNRAVGEI